MSKLAQDEANFCLVSRFLGEMILAWSVLIHFSGTCYFTASSFLANRVNSKKILNVDLCSGT